MRSIDYNNRDLYAFEVLEISMELMVDNNGDYIEGEKSIVSQ